MGRARCSPSVSDAAGLVFFLPSHQSSEPASCGLDPRRQVAVRLQGWSRIKCSGATRAGGSRSVVSVGDLDSATALAIACARGGECRNAPARRIRAAPSRARRRVARLGRAGAAEHRRSREVDIGALGGSVLTAIRGSRLPSAAVRRPAAYVPARNTFSWSLGARVGRGAGWGQDRWIGVRTGSTPAAIPTAGRSSSRRRAPREARDEARRGRAALAISSAVVIPTKARNDRGGRSASTTPFTVSRITGR